MKIAGDLLITKKLTGAIAEIRGGMGEFSE
jgi:hypothetical protein